MQLSLNKILRACVSLVPAVMLAGALCWPMAEEVLGDSSEAVVWLYPDPLVSTTPTNFEPEDRRDFRPVRSDAEYAALAATLREVYSLPVEAWPAPHLAEGVEHRELGPVPEAVYPEANPYSEAKAELGRLLFFDGRLSGPGQMSCGSCHVADLGWADGRARSLGHGAHQLQRNTPSMLNAAHLDELFWDGRVTSLEDLVSAVLHNPEEMSSSAGEVAARVEAIEGYGPLFEAAFGDEGVTFERITQAIATHVRTVVSEPSSAFDRFLGGKKDALSDEAVRGLHLFRTDARCMNCHNGPLMTDGRFHNNGLAYYGRKFEDLGRYRVTKDPEDVGRFRTQGLRNIGRTAPYMHVGFFDLTGVINLYNAGGARTKPRGDQAEDPLWPETSELLVPLHLNERDRADLEAFLASLTERRRRDMLPELPE